MKKKPETAKTLSEKITAVLRGYAKTQLIVVLFVTAIVWMVLSFLGVGYAWLLAIVTGAFAVVPMIGMVTASLLAAIVATFDNARFLPGVPEAVEGIAVLVVYGLLNVFTDYFLSPKLVSRSGKIHPLILLIAVLAATSVFGFVGALLAVPAVLVGKTVYDHYNSEKN